VRHSCSLAPRILPMQSDFEVPAGLSGLWQTTCEPENAKRQRARVRPRSAVCIFALFNCETLFLSPHRAPPAPSSMFCTRCACNSRMQSLQMSSVPRIPTDIAPRSGSRVDRSGSKSFPRDRAISRGPDPDKPHLLLPRREPADRGGRGTGGVSQRREGTARRGGEFRGK